MKISIILPIFNGEETLKECLDALFDIDYPKTLFEIVAVNDGSSDATLEILRKYKKVASEKKIRFAIINFNTNKGRIIARKTGAKKAIHNNLLFVDHRCIVDKDILREFRKIHYFPTIGNPYQDPDRDLLSRFFYVIRQRLYKPYYGQDFSDVYIREDNFDIVPKGFCPFFCEKSELLSSLPQKQGKNINDDTRIFKNMIKTKNILKTSVCRVEYLERTDLKDAITHIFNRGPKFIDFYFNVKSRYFISILGVILLPIFLIVLSVISWKFLLFGMFVLLCLISLCIVFLSYSFKDVLSLFLVGSIMTTIFVLGIYKGVIMKILKKY